MAGLSMEDALCCGYTYVTVAPHMEAVLLFASYLYLYLDPRTLSNFSRYGLTSGSSTGLSCLSTSLLRFVMRSRLPVQRRNVSTYTSKGKGRGVSGREAGDGGREGGEGKGVRVKGEEGRGVLPAGRSPARSQAPVGGKRGTDRVRDVDPSTLTII